MEKINVIGAGLAGVEAVYYLINKGYKVNVSRNIFIMKF